MSDHTPGPWIVEKGDRKRERDISAPNGDPRLNYTSWRGLATVYGSDSDPRAGKLVMRANARLIAAAPEMAARIEALEAEIERMRDAAQALLDADDATPGRDGSAIVTPDELAAHHERWTTARDALRATLEVKDE